MATTSYNIQQKRDRLLKEIAHFDDQMKKFEARDTPQVKRCFTRALHASNDRKRSLQKLLG